MNQKGMVDMDKSLNGVQKNLREAINADEKALNVVNANMTLDEWYENWRNYRASVERC